MRSRAHFRNHPLHPMLIPFPISFLIGGTVADFVGRVGGLAGWWTDLLVAGVATALVAAVPGIIDYRYAVPPESSARKRATQHALANSSALVLFVLALVIKGWPPGAPSLIVLALELAGVVLVTVGGWMGGTLIHRNFIGVEHRYANAGKWKETSVERNKAAVEGGAVVAKADELKVDQMKLIRLDDGTRIALARTEEGHCAFQDRCTHRGGSLADGVLICGTVPVPLARLAIRRRHREGESGARGIPPADVPRRGAGRRGATDSLAPSRRSRRPLQSRLASNAKGISMNSRPVVCEPLEGRQLLAVDLVASALAGRFPGDLVTGAKARIPGLTVQLNNAGDQDVRESVVVRLLASADGVPDGGDPILAEQTNRLRINAGRGRRLPIKFRQVPANVPQGTYRIIAVVDVTGVVAEDNEANNYVGSSGSVAIAPAFVNLTAENLTVDAPLAAGRPTRMTLTVLNSGNSNARGTAVVNVTFTPVGQTSGTVESVNLRVNVRARKTGAIRGRLVVPSTLAAGQYSVSATIGQTFQFTDSNTTDNTATTTPITVR